MDTHGMRATSPALAPGTSYHPKTHTHIHLPAWKSSPWPPVWPKKQKRSAVWSRRLQRCSWDVAKLCVLSARRVSSATSVPRGYVCHLFLEKETIAISEASICLPPLSSLCGYWLGAQVISFWVESSSCTNVTQRAVPARPDCHSEPLFSFFKLEGLPFFRLLHFYLFILGCGESSLLRVGSSQLQQAGAYSLVAVCGFLIVVASPIAEHGL